MRGSEELSNYLVHNRLDGTPRGRDWVAHEVWWQDRPGRVRTDFPGFSAPVLSDRAATVLRDLLEPNGELLPLTCDDGDFWLYNVTNIVDGLDEEHSKGDRFAPGRFIWINKAVFRPDALRNEVVFKIPQKLALMYVTEPLVQSVEESGLTGLDPVLVWSEDQGARWLSGI